MKTKPLTKAQIDALASKIHSKLQDARNEREDHIKEDPHHMATAEKLISVSRKAVGDDATRILLDGANWDYSSNKCKFDSWEQIAKSLARSSADYEIRNMPKIQSEYSIREDLTIASIGQEIHSFSAFIKDKYKISIE